MHLVNHTARLPQFIKTIFSYNLVRGSLSFLIIAVACKTFQRQGIKRQEIPTFDPQFQKTVSDFSSKLYQECSKGKQGKNFVFFTPNILAILSMICAGAPKNVEETLKPILGENWHTEFNKWTGCVSDKSDKYTTLQYLWSLISKVTKCTEDFTYRVYHAVALKQDRKLVQQAKQNLNLYSPSCFSFENGEQAKTVSNQWVEKKTAGKIKDLIKQVDPSTVLILISVALFNGKWTFPFDKSNTKTEKFTNADKTTVQVPMMQKSSSDDYRCWDQFQVTSTEGEQSLRLLELPFHGGISMIIALPNQRKDLNCNEKSSLPQNYLKTLDAFMEFENIVKLTSSNLTTNSSLSDQFKQMDNLSIGIPKVALDDELDLLEDLKEWDLIKMVKQADFNGSMVEKTNKKPIVVDQLKTLTKFEMDEIGVKITAASYATMINESCPPTPPPFLVDRPFGYLFFDNKTKTILGMGRVAELGATHQ